MATATLTKPVEPGAAPPPEEEKSRVPRWVWALVVIGLWVIGWAFTKGNNTLTLGGQDSTPLHDRISEFGAGLSDNAVTAAIGDALEGIVELVQRTISTPVPPSPIPYIGWLGVVAIAAWIGYAVANWRIALLVGFTFLSFGAFGFWEDSMDLLAVTLVSVAITVVIGFPLAVWMGISPRAARVITLFLDLLQTMPTFVYLVIVVILFGVGTPTAVVCTLAYALPPIVRIAGFGIRDVSATTIEATDSLGQTTWQRLWNVQIPMAKSTIILGLNQTILAALSMAIIASYVAGPGLGKPVLAALTQSNFGKGLVPGLLIVLMGIMLDRLTTAASQRSERVARGGGENVRMRRLTLLGLLVPVAVAVWYSRFALNAAIFPETGWGTWIADQANTWMRGFVGAVEGVSGAFKDFISFQILNRTEDLLANSPWWLAFAALLALSLVIGGMRALLPALICLTGLRLLDLWHDSMLVLNMTIIATVLVMLFALVFGVWMARSHRADLVLRPILDAGQTIPAFVYLIPVLALFDVGRFTAIVAGVVYAAPAAIKLVADGISGINQGTVEAGRSSGSTTWQEITKVQLPMAKGSLVLATNQGLLYVLAMVVIGGLVGAQALGYDVIYGLSHSEYWGKGLAAGISIALLGIWIDRVTRAAAERAGAGQAARERAFRIGGWRPAIFTRLSGFGRW
ncbi:MAG: ABC transporter permease subunit [Nocardioidaceae bacterium]|nr:ABC transporter permease subunit [Nocardioidaceae bacterium]